MFAGFNAAAKPAMLVCRVQTRVSFSGGGEESRL